MSTPVSKNLDTNPPPIFHFFFLVKNFRGSHLVCPLLCVAFLRIKRKFLDISVSKTGHGTQNWVCYMGWIRCSFAYNTILEPIKIFYFGINIGFDFTIYFSFLRCTVGSFYKYLILISKSTLVANLKSVYFFGYADFYWTCCFFGLSQPFLKSLWGIPGKFGCLFSLFFFYFYCPVVSSFWLFILLIDVNRIPLIVECIYLL